MKTRNGKIARLPHPIRNSINQRLQDGQSAGVILSWLNAVPAVQAILASRFRCTPINEQNLANWRAGGHQDWLQHQERRDLVRDLAERAGELATDASGLEPANPLSTILVAELALAAREAQAQLTDPAERCQRLQELLGTLARVRQQDFLAGRLAIERERRAREREEEESLDEYRREVAPLARLLKADEDRRMALLLGKRPQTAAKGRVKRVVGDDVRSRGPRVGVGVEERVASKRPCGGLAAPGRSSGGNRRKPGSHRHKGVKADSSCHSAATADLPRRNKAKAGAPIRKPSLGKSRSIKVNQAPATQPSTLNPQPTQGSQPTPNQGESNLIKPKKSNKPAPDQIAAAVPDLEQEAQNRWFRMSRGTEPLDLEELNQLYAAIPPKET